MAATERAAPPGGWTLTAPVTREGFSAFVRAGAYFDPANWPADRRPPRNGGDGILKRIGFVWQERHLPVTRVHWAEAWAYCRSRRGRLPYFDDYAQWEAAPAGKARGGPLAALLGRRRRGASGRPREPDPGLCFWCAEWYHTCWMGEMVKTPVGSPPTRRLYPGLDQRALAEVVRDDIGFRVALPAPAGITAVPGARA